MQEVRKENSQMDDHNQIIRKYDGYTRELITCIQAFILHHRYPRTFKVPDLQTAEKVWRTANAFNVAVHGSDPPPEGESAA